MKPIFYVGAKAVIKTNKRHIFTEIFEHIPAGNPDEARRMFKENWSAPNISLDITKTEKKGMDYKVTKQPERYTAFGYKFKDNSLEEVRVYPNERSFHFKTRESAHDLNIGLNWSENVFLEIIKKLTEDLGLE